MRKVLLLWVLLVAVGAGFANAQVAVPEIGPGAVHVYDIRLSVLPSNSIVPENPAALQWGMPSRVVLGTLRGHATSVTEGTANHYSGSFLGARAVGQSVSVAAASMNFGVDFPLSGGIAPHRDKRLQSAAVAFTLPSTLAWGASVTNYRANSTPGYPAAAPTDHLELHGWTGGVSWRLGEYAYVGGAYGKDKADLTGVYTGSAERRHYMTGASLRGGGTLIWHLEADAFHYDSLTDKDGFIRLPGYNLSQYSAEAILGSWLFTYSGYTLKEVDGGAPDVKGYTADFGFSPLHGFNLTFRHERNDSTNNGTKVSSSEVNSATVAWLF